MFGKSGFVEKWRVNGKRAQGRLELLLAVLFLSCYPFNLFASQYYPPPLLLSFNLADSKDISALEKLQLQHRATYFVAPQLCNAYPNRLREIVTGGSVGLLFTPFGQRDSSDVQNNLTTARQTLEAINGREAVWFRSTLLKSHSYTLELAKEAGFRYDSSESARRLTQDVMPEFPIVAFGEKGAELGLEQLKEQYRQCVSTGRPLIVKFNASNIGTQQEILHGLIDFVLYNGGRLISFDDYLHQLSSNRQEYRGLYVDLGLGYPEPEKLVSEAKLASTTDVFLMAQNGAGKKFYNAAGPDHGSGSLPFVKLTKLLRSEGIRVHAWIAVNRNDRIAAKHPGMAMVDWNGKKSTQWLSPAHPNNVDLKLTIHELVVNHDIDGIHLDHLTYPSLAFDFSEHSISSFERVSGRIMTHNRHKDILEADYFSEWCRWRYLQIESLIRDAASTIAGFSKREILLSAALQASAVVDHTQMVATGQDLSLLAGELDLVVIKLGSGGLSDKNALGERLILTSSLLSGNKPLLIGRTSTEPRPQLKYVSTQFNSAGQWAHGIVTPYNPQEKARLQKRPSVGETLVSPSPPFDSTGDSIDSKVTKAVDDSLSMVRFWLVGVGFILLMMLTALRNIRIMRARKGRREKSTEVAGQSCEIVMPEFIAGFIYAVKSGFPIAPTEADTTSKLAIILTSGMDAMMFYINTERKTDVSTHSQILVTQSEIPRLSADAYLDASRLIDAGDAAFRVEAIVGVVPERLKLEIRAQVERNPSLSKEKKDHILREFR